MLMEKFWVVKNPTEHSTVQDICWETTPNEFAKYVAGVNFLGNDLKYEAFEQECHAFHTSERTAKADAEGRMRIRDTILKTLAAHRAQIREMK